MSVAFVNPSLCTSDLSRLLLLGILNFHLKSFKRERSTLLFDTDSIGTCSEIGITHNAALG